MLQQQPKRDDERLPTGIRLMGRKTDGATLMPPPLDDEQVAAYLSAHPDFLGRHPELLAVLDPPSRWNSDRVVDLQAAMVMRLRSEVERVKGTAETLVHASRSNLFVQTRAHRAVLALLAAESLDTLVQAVTDDLPALLGVDVATLCFEDSGPAASHLFTIGALRLAPDEVLRRMKGRDRDCILSEGEPGDPALFGGGAGLVGAQALVRLTPGGRAPEGLMALGSRDSRSFHAGQGSEFLTFLARVVESCLRRFIG